MKGGCRCGAVRYETKGEPFTAALCHCNDCRRSAGAPVVAWSMFPENAIEVTQGNPKAYESSKGVTREFCANCGTGLFYKNPEMLPGIIDVQSATFDEPNNMPAKCHVQTAEQLTWFEGINSLPKFERYPPQE
jgi:hypothetical protein